MVCWILYVTRIYIFRSIVKSKGSAHTPCSTWQGEGEKFGDALAEKIITLSMNSNMVKPEKYDHLHLGYHFAISLNSQTSDSFSCWFVVLKCLQQNWSFSWKFFIIKLCYYCRTLFHRFGDGSCKLISQLFQWFRLIRALN